MTSLIFCESVIMDHAHAKIEEYKSALGALKKSKSSSNNFMEEQDKVLVEGVIKNFVGRLRFKKRSSDCSCLLSLFEISLFSFMVSENKDGGLISSDKLLHLWNLMDEILVLGARAMGEMFGLYQFSMIEKWTQVGILAAGYISNFFELFNNMVFVFTMGKDEHGGLFCLIQNLNSIFKTLSDLIFDSSISSLFDADVDIFLKTRPFLKPMRNLAMRLKRIAMEDGKITYEHAEEVFTTMIEVCDSPEGRSSLDVDNDCDIIIQLCRCALKYISFHDLSLDYAEIMESDEEFASQLLSKAFPL